MAATETSEQRALLDQIEQQAKLLDACQETVDTTRQQLWTLMMQAKDLNTSSYSIAKVAGISQPRVMQIYKEVKGATQAPDPTTPEAPATD